MVFRRALSCLVVLQSLLLVSCRFLGRGGLKLAGPRISDREIIIKFKTIAGEDVLPTTDENGWLHLFGNQTVGNLIHEVYRERHADLLGGNQGVVVPRIIALGGQDALLRPLRPLSLSEELIPNREYQLLLTSTMAFFEELDFFLKQQAFDLNTVMARLQKTARLELPMLVSVFPPGYYLQERTENLRLSVRGTGVGGEVSTEMERELFKLIKEKFDSGAWHTEVPEQGESSPAFAIVQQAVSICRPGLETFFGAKNPRRVSEVVLMFCEDGGSSISLLHYRWGSFSIFSL